jgi:hypothetical protein
MPLRAGPELPPFDGQGVCAAMGFTSTVRDLAKLAAWQHRTLSGKDARILQRATLKDMTRVHWIDPSWETSWGLGYAVSKGHKNSVVVGHGGACPGYSTQFSTVPKTGLAVIVMVNCPEVAAGITDTLLRLLSTALAESGSPADPAPSLANELSDYCGIYDAQPWGAESAVVEYHGKLAMFGLGGGGFEGTEKLRPVADQLDLFRVERSNDEGLGEAITFQRDGDGTVVSKTRHAQINRKLDDARPRPIVPLRNPATQARKTAGRPIGWPTLTTTTVTQPDGTRTVTRSTGGGNAAKL